MKIIVNNNESDFQARKLTIIVSDVEFEITVNQFSELVINKGQFGEGESALTIKPSTSNEVRLS